MKKFLTIVLSLALAVTACLGLTACGGEGTKYVANAIEGVEGEEFGFAIGKNSSKKVEILAAMNEVIAESDLEKIVNYFDAIYHETTPADTLDFPNLDDNTAGVLNVYTESGFAPFEFVDDEGNVEKFEVLDFVEFEGNDYAVLLPVTAFSIVFAAVVSTMPAIFQQKVLAVVTKYY